MSTPPSTPDRAAEHSEPLNAPDLSASIGGPLAAGPDRSSAPDRPARDLADIGAVEVISRAAVMLMSAAAEQLGLSATDPADPEHRDLDEARTLITALAGLVRASAPDLGPHAAAFRDGLSALQRAFREFSLVVDAPGTGPGER